MTVVVDLRRTLPGPPSLVWELITDWERQDLWMLEASDIVVDSEHREGIGVTSEATVKIGPISTRDSIRVDAWEPQRHLGIEHLGWVGGRGDLWLEEAGAETDFRWREELRPPWGWLGAVGLRLYRPLLERAFRRDLDALERLVRKRLTPPPGGASTAPGSTP